MTHFSPDLEPLPGVTLGALQGLLGAELSDPAAASVEVRGAVGDNRQVRPGNLMVALPGEHVHGAKFAADAQARGAVAFLTDPAGVEIARAAGCELPALVVPSPGAVAARAAAAAWGNPADKLRLFGVTGTNGKTTTTYLLGEILRRLGRRSGAIGTVEVRVGEESIPAQLTTPQATDLQALFAVMVQSGCSDLVMEVSSHALALGRVATLTYRVAGFTNLTQDHLDFHGTMEDYFDAKARLFTPEYSQLQVVNVGDKWGRQLVSRIGATNPAGLVTFALDSPENPAAGMVGPLAPTWTVRAREAAGEPTLITFTAESGEAFTARLAMPGHFNAANAALAILMVWADLAAATNPTAATGTLTAALEAPLEVSVPGRMEVISARPRVIVDFAHNPDATEKLLQNLAPTTSGRLILVFGSAGQRDALKRPIMGKIAVENADLVYVTDDDPHEEDPAAIRADVLRGCVGGKAEVVEIPDRREAIHAAIKAAAPEDTVVLAGRGHETEQPVGIGSVPLDDREVAREALRG